jgi:hypothetical protein
MLTVVRVPQIVNNTANITAASHGACSRTKTVYTLCLGQEAPYPFLLPYVYQSIFIHKVRIKRDKESLWFGLRLFPIKYWGQHMYTISTNKEITKNQFLLHLEILRDSLCFRESHTLYSTSLWNKKKSYIYAVSSRCKRITCLHKTSQECIHV